MESAVQLVAPPSKERRMSAVEKSKKPRIDLFACIFAPGFILDNRALFGLPPAGPPVDPLLGNGPGPTFVPSGRVKNGGYSPVSNNASREVKGGGYAELGGYVGNVFKCATTLGGQ